MLPKTPSFKIFCRLSLASLKTFSSNNNDIMKLIRLFIENCICVKSDSHSNVCNDNNELLSDSHFVRVHGAPIQILIAVPLATRNKLHTK